MFDFNTYEMPSMFNSSLNYNNNRFSQRGNDIWSLFEDDYQPLNNQRRVVNRRRSPLYEDYDGYTAAEKPSLRYRNPQPNIFVNKGTMPNFYYPVNEVQSSKRYQPKAQDQASTSASRSNNQIIEKKINFSLLSNFMNNLMATIITIILTSANLLNSIRSRITTNNRLKPVEDCSISKNEPESKTTSFTEEKKEAKVPSKTESKSSTLPEVQQSKPQSVKSEKKLPTEQSLPKVQSSQNKRDLVIIEDVTPSRPKFNPAMEPRRGLIVEEVNPSQL